MWVGLRINNINEFQWDDGTLFADTELKDEEIRFNKGKGNQFTYYKNGFRNIVLKHKHYYLCQISLIGFTPNKIIQEMED